MWQTERFVAICTPSLTAFEIPGNFPSHSLKGLAGSFSKLFAITNNGTSSVEIGKTTTSKQKLTSTSSSIEKVMKATKLSSDQQREPIKCPQ